MPARLLLKSASMLAPGGRLVESMRGLGRMSGLPTVMGPDLIVGLVRLFRSGSRLASPSTLGSVSRLGVPSGMLVSAPELALALVFVLEFQFRPAALAVH